MKVKFLDLDLDLTESAYISKIASVRDICTKLKIKELDIDDKWTKTYLEDLTRYIDMSRKVNITPKIVYGNGWFVFVGAGCQRGYGGEDTDTMYNNIVIFTVVSKASLKPNEEGIDPNIMHISRFSAAQEVFVPFVKELKKPLEVLLTNVAEEISRFSDYMDIQSYFRGIDYVEYLEKLKQLGKLSGKEY